MNTSAIIKENFLLKMHPLQRIAVSVLFAIAIGFFIRNANQGLLFVLISIWVAFAFCFLILSWIVLFKRTVAQIKIRARDDDGSSVFVIFITIFAAFAAILTVLLLVISSNNKAEQGFVKALVCFTSVILSWVMVHTILSFHYAHLYYDDDESGKNKTKGGLVFPDESSPDYIDFAYFSFVIGMTFQVSDVTVNNKKLRRLVLLHSLISFLLNTFVVALTVNFIAGLSE